MSKYSPQKIRTLLWVSRLFLALKVNPHTTETICEAGCPLPIDNSQHENHTTQVSSFAEHTNYL